MELGTFERIVLLMLADIAERVGGDSSFEPAFIREAVNSNNAWAIPFQYSGLYSEDRLPEVVHEVIDILDMWIFIEDSGGRSFPGFDGNEETNHLSVARFFTEHMGRFEKFKGRLDSGIHELERYRAMLPVFEPMRVATGSRLPVRLTPEEVGELLEVRANART